MASNSITVDDRPLKSLRSTEFALVTFVNKSLRKASVYWLDFHGQRVRYSIIWLWNLEKSCPLPLSSRTHGCSGTQILATPWSPTMTRRSSFLRRQILAENKLACIFVFQVCMSMGNAGRVPGQNASQVDTSVTSSSSSSSSSRDLWR